MIYDTPNLEDPIRQGDIFIGIPRVEISLQKIAILNEEGYSEEIDWDCIADSSEDVTVVVPVRAVAGIVITQDCDAVRDTDITLCQIRPFSEVYPPSSTASKPKSMVNIITQHSRRNLDWFYLPPDSRIGFNTRQAVVFSICVRVPRIHLESLRTRRRARLNSVADEHFREKLSEYFRRYPYDEWYPLNQEEFKLYHDGYPEAQPFPWQSELESEN